MRRRASLLFVSVLTAALALSACGSEEPEAKSGKGSATAKTVSIGDIEVEGDMGSKPKLANFSGPVKFAKTDTKVLDKGDGAEIKEGQQVEVDYIGFNARTGKSFDDSWSKKQTATFPLKAGSMIQGFVDGLVGQKIGSRVVVGMPSKDGYPDGNEQAGIKKGDSLLFVVELKKAWTPLAKATGTEVKPPSSLPAVTTDKNDQVTGVAKPKGEAPKELVTQPLIRGDGDKVEKDSNVQLHVVATNWRTGKVFDSTWQRKQPLSMALPQLAAQISGLGEALEGQSVGSRVLVVLPPDKGIGQDLQGTDVKKSDTTIWVVDILDSY